MQHTPRGTLDHHFLEGRKYRADDIGEALAHRNWWRLATFGAIGWGMLATLGLIYVATLPKQIPWPIRWDSSTGEMRPLALAPEAMEHDNTIRYWLREFVHTLRSVSSDKDHMQRQWNLTMTRLTKEGKARFVAYEAQVKPLQQQEYVKVEVLQRSRLSKQTWQVRWRETREHPEDMQHVTTVIQRGVFVFQQRPPRTTDELDYNPAGIFFHEWSWEHE
jgi:type IV secretory pathway TrbF-like protein